MTIDLNRMFMKIKLAFSAMILAGVMGCNENKTETRDHSHEQDSATHAHSEKQSQLVLNAGKKWQLDEATRNNIDSIKKTVQTVEVSKTKDYAKTATDLENDANRLVSQCRMSGKDHDMLHLWLESFLSDLKELKTSSKEEQPIVFDRIKNHVNEFDNYFE
jgi:hypothetical protein